ncbi:MAG: TIGR00730 family Rossman fold protein [Alphaproteobacteria bacterium]|nr:TIGR00730 family Rossman fold protein [Alphaproteobacteria bacterium]
MNLKKLCVFCGSKDGISPKYQKNATRLGQLIAQNDIELIYGAGGTGLMGAVANACKQNGGRVVGMTISHLFKIERPDLMKDTIDEIQVYQKMFARKFAMTSAAQAFCILPGGIGTVDELVELMVLKQLGLFSKPIIVLNIENFFNPFRQVVHHMIDQGFMKPEHLDLVKTVDNVEDVLPAIEEALKKTC